MVSLLILWRSFLISVNSGFRIINFAANIQLLRVQRISAFKLLIVQCEVQKRWSGGRFDGSSTVACKGTVWVEVSTSFCSRFFVEVGQFN